MVMLRKKSPMAAAPSLVRGVTFYSVTYLLHLSFGVLAGGLLALPVYLVLSATSRPGIEFLLPAIAGYAVLDTAFRTRSAIARNQQFFVPWELLAIPVRSLVWLSLLTLVFATIVFGIATASGWLASESFNAPVLGFLVAAFYPYLELKHGGPRGSPAWIGLESSLLLLHSLGLATRISLDTFFGLLPISRQRGGLVG